MDYILSSRTNVAIIGGAGYTAGELLRILIRHSAIHGITVQSSSQQGKSVSDIHADLLGETDIVFQQEVPEDADLYFLCMGHGRSQAFLEQYPEVLKKDVIDLSNEYRLEGDHGFIYGLPEVNREEIKRAKHIANPGCFATAIQLGLLPLAHANLLDEDIHIHGITGSTGAGQKPVPTTHFAWRNNNVSIYKAFTHQHLPEIRRTISQLHPFYERDIYFVPMRGDFARGIFASISVPYDGDLSDAITLYDRYYREHPFVQISEHDIHMKQVVNTNKCILQLRKHGRVLHISSVIDNLTKGASGQAVQNMNLMMGIEETTGLNLKANYF